MHRRYLHLAENSGLFQLDRFKFLKASAYLLSFLLIAPLPSHVHEIRDVEQSRLRIFTSLLAVALGYGLFFQIGSEI